MSGVKVKYKADFGGTDKDVIAHVTFYAGADLAAVLVGVSKIAFYDYDWRLNEAAGSRNTGQSGDRH